MTESVVALYDRNTPSGSKTNDDNHMPAAGFYISSRAILTPVMSIT
jgi:hypothetical protein